MYVQCLLVTIHYDVLQSACAYITKACIMHTVLLCMQLHLVYTYPNLTQSIYPSQYSIFSCLAILFLVVSLQGNTALVGTTSCASSVLLKVPILAPPL